VLCSTQGVLTVGVEQACPASIAFLHLTRGYKEQGTSQAYARVVVLVVDVDVVEVVVVDVVKVVVVRVVVVTVVVVVIVVVVVVVVVEVVLVDVFVVLVDEVVVKVTVVVEFGSIYNVKQEQMTVSFVKFHA
jgi:hypothetical protein